MARDDLLHAAGTALYRLASGLTWIRFRVVFSVDQALGAAAHRLRMGAMDLQAPAHRREFRRSRREHAR